MRTRERRRARSSTARPCTPHMATMKSFACSWVMAELTDSASMEAAAPAAAPTAVESAFSLIDYTGMLMMSL